MLRFFAIALATATVSACGALAPPVELDRDARAFMGLLARNQVDSAMALLDVAGNPDTIRAVLQQGREFLRRTNLDSAKLIGWNVVLAEDTRGSLTYETEADTGQVLIGVSLVRAGASSRITSIHWQPMAVPLADLNAFSMNGLGVAHYAYLVLALLSVAACLGGAIFAGVRRMGVLWILLCLVGVGKATIDWTTGHQVFNPVNIQLFGAGAVRQGTVGPWLVSWSLPLGTIAMLLTWRRRRLAKPTSGPEVRPN